ncbi:DUF554 domain-containing protein [Clostridia bacterium]|nr:DUF554 domain-containing protein [Clostridia bacterium]
MPAGVIINVLSVFFGGILGAIGGKRLSEELKRELTMIFGICAFGMGIAAIGLMKNMPVVIFSVVLGTAIGLLTNLGNWIHRLAIQMQKPFMKLFEGHHSDMSHDEFMASLVTIIVLFCASGTGIYGSIDAGMTGDSTILISKSILDFFTAAIFASQLGAVVSLIAVPQFLILGLLAVGAKLIFPLTTPEMIMDFKACGGFLLLATGLRIAGIKSFPIADMIPAMALVLPLSYIWTNVVTPLLS